MPARMEMSREAYYDLLWTYPAKILAPALEISSETLFAVSRSFDIPRPPNGYWLSIAQGKSPTKTPLAPNTKGTGDTVRIWSRSAAFVPPRKIHVEEPLAQQIDEIKRRANEARAILAMAAKEIERATIQRRQDEERWTHFAKYAAVYSEVQSARAFLEAIKACTNLPDLSVGDKTVDEWIQWTEARIAHRDPLTGGAEAVFSRLIESENVKPAPGR